MIPVSRFKKLEGGQPSIQQDMLRAEAMWQQAEEKTVACHLQQHDVAVADTAVADTTVADLPGPADTPAPTLALNEVVRGVSCA